MNLRAFPTGAFCRRWACALSLAGAGLASSPVLAQPSGANVATELFNAGRDLMKMGNYAAACPKLASSARLDAKVGTLARLAECEEKLGQVASARTHWLQAFNLARVERDARLSHVEAELARVDKIVPKLKMVSISPLPAEASLVMDGIDVGAASFGVALPVEPGRHTVVVAARGKQTWSSEIVTSADGAVVVVQVPTLQDLPAEPVTATPLPPPSRSASTAPPPPSDARSGSTLRVGGWITAGVGVVAMGAGTVFALRAKTKLADSNAQGCDPNNDCSDPGFGLRNEARTAGNVSTLLFVAGGVLAAGGLTLAILAPKSASAHASAPSASLGVGVGSLVVHGSY